jgi:polysaccharide pyruvyl transferase WcaK-like protein
MVTEETIKLMDIINILAIIMGPIIAISMTRYLDKKRDIEQRKFQIFKELMVTRTTQINPEHVKALNAIEIEFYNDEKVINAWKKYFDTLHERLDPDPNMNLAFSLRKQQVFARLVHAIAVHLKINIEQLDILAGGYAPQGWANDENEQREIRRRFLKLLDSDNGSLKVQVVNPSQKTNDVTEQKKILKQVQDDVVIQENK